MVMLKLTGLWKPCSSPNILYVYIIYIYIYFKLTFPSSKFPDIRKVLSNKIPLNAGTKYYFNECV